MTDLQLLYVEDEVLLGRIVQESLESRGCRIDWYKSLGEAAGADFPEGGYDAAVIDVQLPDGEGFTLAKQLRGRYADLPILFLTARVTARDALAGFAAGGNDYIRKPFSMEELLVRIQNLVRLRADRSPRKATDTADPLTFGRCTFDHRRLALTTPEGDFELSHREAELLRLLYDHRTLEVIPRSLILNELWGDDGFFHSRNLDVYMRKLRGYLGREAGVVVVTLRGVGYRWVEE